MGGVGVALAIVVGLVSSFVQSLGLTIQRKSHIQNDALPLDQQRTPTRRPLWLFGFGIYITSNIFATIFQLDTLPIVILAPLGAVSLIFNALLARLILGDRFGKRTIAGTALVAVGATLIAVFGVVQEEEHGIGELLRLWARPAFLGFFGSVLGVTLVVLVIAHIATYVTYRAMRHGQIRLPEDDEEPLLRSATPSHYASSCHHAAIPFRTTSNQLDDAQVTPRSHIAAEGTIRETTALLGAADIDKMPTAAQHDIPPRSRVRFASIGSAGAESHDYLSGEAAAADMLVVQPTPAQQKTITLAGLAFAACSGVISGMSLVLAKAAVELLVMTLDYYRTGKGANQFAHPQSWFLVAGLAIGGVAQLVYLNYSLCFASPALICPLAFCFFNISSIFDGLVFYDQFSLLSPTQVGLVSTGVAVLLLGVVVVSAVQPTGAGGVDVGTWVEDESAMDEEEDDEEVGGKLPDQLLPRSASPELIGGDAESDVDADGSSQGTIRASEYLARRSGGTDSDSDMDGQGSQPLVGLSHSTPALPPGPRARVPLLQRRSTMPHEDFSIPLPAQHRSSGFGSASGVLSPNMSSPMSPTTARKRRRRYGSLLPLPLPLPHPYQYQRHGDRDSIPAAAPGFAIGLGAASPGFMLRSEHEMSHFHNSAAESGARTRGGRRVRSQSEGQEQIARLVRAGRDGVHHGGSSGGGGRVSDSREGRRRSVEGSALRPSASGLSESQGSPEPGGRIAPGEMDAPVRDGTGAGTGASWWRQFFGGGDRPGRIKLGDDSA